MYIPGPKPQRFNRQKDSFKIMSKTEDLLKKLTASPYYAKPSVKGHVAFLGTVKGAEKYAQEFKDLPNINTTEHAQKALNKIDAVYQRHEEEKDEQGMLHAAVMAEVARNHARIKGLRQAEQLFSDWLKNIKKK